MSAFLDQESLELLGDSLPPSDPPAPAGFVRVASGAGRELAIAGDAYEGASHMSREMAMWQPALRSADNDILPHKRTADARVRDTFRNDAYVRGGATLHKDNIVGGMFMLNSKPATKVLLGKEDETFEEEFQEEVEAKFTLWAESPDNWVDAQRINNFTGMVRLATGIFVAAGEILASAEWLRDWDGVRPFNTAIQMIDLDRLSTPPTLMGDRNVRGGIERNKFGAPQAYHVRMAHPTDYWSNADAYTWKRVPVRKPWGRLQMIHIFEQDRPDQTRGISEMVAALKEMRQTKDFREVVLQNAVVNATYAASIESDLDTNAIFERLGGGNLGQENDYEGAINGYIGAYLNTVAQYIGDRKQFQIGGVRIPHLPPGSKLQLRPAGQGGPLGTEFEQSLLRYIAANLGVSYEQLSRDYTQTNYSSARAAMTETWKFMQSRKKMVADRFATLIFRLWLEEALNKGMIESLPRRLRGVPTWLYQGQNFDAISRCDWIGASRGQIDELKESQAAVLRIKYGLTTREDELSRLGKDWRAVFRQMKREKGLQDELGIEFDQQDNSMNAASGSPQQREAKQEKDDGSEDNTDA